MKKIYIVLLLICAISGLLLFLGSFVVIQDVTVKPKNGEEYKVRKYLFPWQDRVVYEMNEDGSWTAHSKYVYGYVDGDFSGGASYSGRD